MIDAKTSLYCIFGNPVKHSMSPVIQNAAFKQIGINAVYLAFQPKSISDAVSSMKSLNILGASITIPYKRDVIDCIDELDDLAGKIGSVNTLINIDGRIKGFNTDGYGALLALKNNNHEVENKNILLLGNGGSSRAISFTLLENGSKITIAGRNQERILPLVYDLRKYYSDVGYLLIKDLTADLTNNFDIIINTTSVGMAPNKEIPIKENLLNKKHIVFDIVYSPNTTPLLSAAKSFGCKIVYGKEMLLFQGVKQFEIWTGKKAPVNVMKDILNDRIV